VMCRVVDCHQSSSMMRVMPRERRNRPSPRGQSHWAESPISRTSSGWTLWVWADQRQPRVREEMQSLLVKVIMREKDDLDPGE
jgi:hypothetical protein